MFPFNSWNLTNWFKRFDLALYQLPPMGFEAPIIPNLITGDTRTPADTIVKNNTTPKPENSKKTAESAVPTPEKLTTLTYPSDLATKYRHYLQILILKQSSSKYSQPTISRNYNWGSDQFTSAMGGIDKSTEVGGQANAQDAILQTKVFNGTAMDVWYSYKAWKGGGAYGTSRKAMKPLAYIQLYMPETMQIDLKQDFDRLSVTDALGFAGQLGGAASGESQDAQAAKSGVFGDAKDLIALGQMTQGYALNPQMELLYKGPNNRQFRYTFKFVPRNASEAKTVEDIITTLRFHASPEYSPGSLSRQFVPPSEFRINHMIDAGYNYSLPRIGQCVLDEVNVNYAPSGHWATFKDGRPIEIQMDLTFTEVSIITKADVEAGF